MYDKFEEVLKRYQLLTEKLADPAIYSNQEELTKVSEERGGLEELVTTYKEYKEATKNNREMVEILKGEKDEEMRTMAQEELTEGEKKVKLLEEKLKVLLLPKDPLDEKNVMVEIRAGAGGDEASIFVADVYRMYQNYFKSLNFKMELISLSEGDQGIKEVIFSVRGKSVYSKLKYESGVHRVQRVPVTESQGRVHTSTITVAVLPEPEEIDFVLNMNDVRIDVYRAGGPGGQSVNTTDSAVRVTHIPTGTVVANQDQKSQIKNKDKALRILKNRIYDQMVREKQEAQAQERRGMVGKGDRSERVRTYNFPQGRLSDHRIGLTIYNLEKIMEGSLGHVTDSLIAYNQAELLKGKED